MMDHSENDAPTEARAPSPDVTSGTPLEPPAELVGDAPDEEEEAGRGDAAPLEPVHAQTEALEPHVSDPAPWLPFPAAPPPEPVATIAPPPEPVAAIAPPPEPVATIAPPPEAAPGEQSRPEPATVDVAQTEPSDHVAEPEVAGQTALVPPAPMQSVAATEPVPADHALPDAASNAPAPAPAGEANAPAGGAGSTAAPAPVSAQAEERRVRAQQAWERVVNAHASGETLSGNVTTAVKGGLLVDIGGIRGFLPASQVRVALGTALETLVKTKLPLKVIDIDTARRRAVVSHRRAADDERRTKRAEVLRSLQVGQTRDGVVVRLADFGAFVDLGGIDGLIPMRELAFERVEKVQDVLTVGERLPVVVLRIEEGGKKISLSRRNALPDPWRDHANVLRRDATVEGKVVGKEPRLQVELAPGVVGTVRESDANPADYEIGEAIEVAVRSVDRATRRITLTTMHSAPAAPEQASSTSSGFAPLGVELGRRP